MFSELEAIVARPALFSVTTTELLWADPHISERMLRYHLDGTVNLSSRTTDIIDRSIDWLVGPGGVAAGTRVLDLGCGPGLYSNRLAVLGADVTGVDFSARSIRYARDTAPLGPGRATYIHGNYLDVPIPGAFDVALMIFCDFCALDSEQRGHLLERLRTVLAPRGRFLFDVYGLAALAAHAARTTFNANPTGGFWSPDSYFEFRTAFVYAADRVTLDKYDIVEANRTRTICNWLQHYDVPALEEELGARGFELRELLGDLTGAPFDAEGTEFAVVSTVRTAQRRPAP
jgi:SAM-dependent methyltransferase